MGLEGILGRLHALLSLEPDKTELVLDVVDHDLTTLFTTLIGFLSGGVGTLELEVVAASLLEVLAAIGLDQDAVNLLEVEGIGEELVSGDDVL